MFSLIMHYSDYDWDILPGEKRRDSAPLSRYLEYTDPEISVRLQPVSDVTLATLEDIPTLFMSELKNDTAGDQPDYVTMRVGRVSNLTVDSGTIYFDFQIDADLGRFPIPDMDTRKRVEQALGLGRWELTRTHWAIKRADLADALAELGLDMPAQEDDADSQGVDVIADAVKTEDVEIVQTLEEYLAIVLGDSGASGDQIFYRGHSDKSYRLEPSLFRKNATGGPRFLRDEDRMVRELLSERPGDFAGDLYMIDKLVRMQHFGLPTRLLDVTSNPLVGLYFCCSGVKVDKNGDEIDGEVIILSTRKADIKFYDSDTVSCIANLAMLPHEYKERMNTDLSIADFKNSDECKRLLHFIGAEKPYFKPAIDPTDLGRIVFVKARQSNARISSQSGAFLLFGRDAILPETGHSSLNVRRIVVRKKREILDQLHRMNIKSSTIYPGIEKTTAEIAREYDNQG
ncbi:MAG: FRG domain-containing protein [Sphingomonas pseudosanguinis]|uniref:FRG domain-containing protein n=1 Tax=Sphingomonas pseudosanguinis TaxID=413712 RepID=UPI00391B2FD5